MYTVRFSYLSLRFCIPPVGIVIIFGGFVLTISFYTHLPLC